MAGGARKPWLCPLSTRKPCHCCRVQEAKKPTRWGHGLRSAGMTWEPLHCPCACPAATAACARPHPPVVQ
eukprot:258174-Pelagomonas_calceolata.AAC.1